MIKTYIARIEHLQLSLRSRRRLQSRELSTCSARKMSDVLQEVKVSSWSIAMMVLVTGFLSIL